MNGTLEWGHEFIRLLQQFSPALDPLFKAITTLGAEPAFLLLLPLVFWCMDKRHGVRLGVLLVLSAYLNLALKTLFDQPRPSPNQVKILAEEATPGLPSGHSQNSVVFYGFLAAQARRSWAWIVAGLIAFGVGLSRIYLGVHFPSDVLSGWFVGIVLLALYLRAGPEMERRTGAWPWGFRMFLAVAAPLVLFLINANENNARIMGIMLGLLAGVLIEWRWVSFSAEGPLLQRALRFVVGGVILIVVWLGTKAVFPTQPETVALTFRLIRYALVGAWATLGAPWLFVRLGLASRESSAWA